MSKLDADQFEEKLIEAFGRFFTILNTHQVFRRFVETKQPEFYEMAVTDARQALDKILSKHGDIGSVNLKEKFPLVVPGFVSEFPLQRNQLWLIGSVSAFEVYFKEAIVLVLRHKPDLIDEKHEKDRAPLHKQMEALRSLKDKLDFSATKLRVEFNDKEFTRDQLSEIQARRNAFVHHDCVVTEQYLRGLHEGTRPELGDCLDVPDEYRETSGKCLAQAGLHLNRNLLKKFSRGKILPAHLLEEC